MYARIWEFHLMSLICHYSYSVYIDSMVRMIGDIILIAFIRLLECREGGAQDPSLSHSSHLAWSYTSVPSYILQRLGGTLDE
jgi:hypothetical protein